MAMLKIKLFLFIQILSLVSGYCGYYLCTKWHTPYDMIISYFILLIFLFGFTILLWIIIDNLSLLRIPEKIKWMLLIFHLLFVYIYYIFVILQYHWYKITKQHEKAYLIYYQLEKL